MQNFPNYCPVQNYSQLVEGLSTTEQNLNASKVSLVAKNGTDLVSK